MVAAIIIVHSAPDGQQDLRTAGQTGKIINSGRAVPGVDPGHNLTIGRTERGLAGIGHSLAVDDLAVNGISKGQRLGIAHQRHIHLLDAVQDAVAIGRQGVMGRIINDLAILIQQRAGIGVYTQNPIAVAQAGPKHSVVFVGIGQTVGSGIAEEAVVIPEAAVEDRRIGPVAIEAQEGQAQINVILLGVFQVDITFHIDAVFKVGLHPGLVLGGQCDRGCHIGYTAGRNRNRILAEGDGAAERPLLLCHEVNAGDGLHILRQQAEVQGVALLRVREVVDLETKRIHAIGVVAHGYLGLIAANGQVGLGRHGRQRIDQTGALLTGRSFQVCGAADNGFGSTHQQRLSQRTDGAIGHIGIDFIQVLHYQRRNTGNLGGSHGSTIHNIIPSLINRGVHAAANAGDVRCQCQVGRHAPGGERAHLTSADRRYNALLCGNSQLFVFRSSHRLAGRLTDGDGRNIAGNALRQGSRRTVGHIHGKELAGVGVVINDQANGPGSLGVCQLQGEVDGTTLNHGDLTGHIQALKVRGLAQAGNHHILQLSTDGQRIKAHVQATGLGISHHGVAIGKEGRHTLGVVGTGHGGGVDIDGRGIDGGIVRMLGGVLVGAPQILLGAGSVIAGGNGYHDILGGNALVDQIQLGIGGAKTGSRAQRQVGNIAAKGHGIFQCGNNIIRSTGSGGTEDLHNDDLGIRCHAYHIRTLHIGVGSGNAGNVAAVVALLVSAVVSVQVAV